MPLVYAFSLYSYRLEEEVGTFGAGLIPVASQLESYCFVATFDVGRQYGDSMTTRFSSSYIIPGWVLAV